MAQIRRHGLNPAQSTHVSARESADQVRVSLGNSRPLGATIDEVSRKQQMIGRYAYLRERLQTSIWPIPLLMTLLSGLLGALMLWVDRLAWFEDLGPEWFAMEMEPARQLLSLIAGSTIGVGGVAFSVTMVALTLTSGQYGPKILRHFLEDEASKTSLGLFLGTYVYCLIVLTGFLPGDEPRWTTIMALTLAVSALISFVRFTHRTATDLQADEIVHRIGRQLQSSLEQLVGEASGENGRRHGTLAWRRQARGHRPVFVAAKQRGYIQTIDYDALCRWCAENDCAMQVRVRAGDFVVAGSCLLKVYAGDATTVETSLQMLRETILAGPIRTPVQDPEYPITQLNQLAARALSPGINDPGTAVTCIDGFSAAVADIVDRDLPGSAFVDENNVARVLIRQTTFPGLIKAIYAPLRQFATKDVAVNISLMESLCRVADLTTRERRLHVLAEHGETIWRAVKAQDFAEPRDFGVVDRAYRTGINGQRLR